MPVWLWVGLATMFVSVLHIIIDFGVGLFDLHGTLTLTEAATLVGVALIQLWWAISFMAGARGNGSGVASAGILGAGWAALTNGFPIVYCPPVCEEARPLSDLAHVGSMCSASCSRWSPSGRCGALGRARVGSCRPLRRPWWSGLWCRWRTPRSHRRTDAGMVGRSAPTAADPCVRVVAHRRRYHVVRDGRLLRTEMLCS